MIGERLKEIREQTGMNKKEFADFIGIKYTTYNNYETEAREPASDFLILISTKFDVSIDYILGLQVEKEILHSYKLKSSEFEHIKKYRDLDNHGREHINSVLEWETKRMAALSDMQKQLNEKEMHISKLNITELPTRIITYYQKLASAGNGEYLFDDVPTDMIKVVDNELSDRADFVIGVNGDSMEPTYYDGDKVYVSKTDSIPVGSIGIFTRGNECFIKELGNNCLISHNKKYNDIPANDEIRLVGEVLGKVVEE